METRGEHLSFKLYWTVVTVPQPKKSQLEAKRAKTTISPISWVKFVNDCALLHHGLMDMLLPDFSLGMYQLFSQESPNLSLREPYNTPWPVIQKQELSRSVNASLCKKHHHESSLPSSIDGTRHVSMLYLFVKTSSMSWRLLVVRPWCSLLIFYLLTLLLRTLITYTELTSVPLRSTIYSHCSCWPPSQNLPPSVFDAALYHYLYHNKVWLLYMGLQCLTWHYLCLSRR